MRRSACVLTVLAVLALALDSPREYDDRTEVSGLEGTWRMVGHGIVLTCHGGTWTLDTGGGERWHGSDHIDTTRNPPHLDRYYANGPYQGKTFKFIYQIDGDALRIAGHPTEATAGRPKGFNDNGFSVWTYKRVK